MQTTVAQPRPTAAAGWFMTWAGLALLATAVLLYVTGASRALALWITPVGLGVGVVGGATLRGAAVPRWVLLLLAVVAAALLVLGLATWIYAEAHPPTSV